MLVAIAERNGKTLHLLKSGSKPTKIDRKRKKIPILGTFGEYTESKKKPQPLANASAQPKVQNQPAGGSSIVQYMAPAPSAKDAKMAGK